MASYTKINLKIKYILCKFIFVIIGKLPSGKICNFLNFSLVIILGSNHTRRLEILKRKILNINLHPSQDIIFERLGTNNATVFIGDSHAEFCGRNFVSKKYYNNFYTYHTGATLLSTFGTSDDLLMRIFYFINLFKKKFYKEYTKINIVFSFGEIDIRTFFFQSLKVDKSFKNENLFFKFLADNFFQNFTRLHSLVNKKNEKKIHFFFKGITPPTYIKNYTIKNLKEFDKIRSSNDFPILGLLKDRIRWNKKLSKIIERKCNKNIKFIKLDKENYAKDGSLNSKKSVDNIHLDDVVLIKKIQKKI